MICYTELEMRNSSIYSYGYESKNSYNNDVVNCSEMLKINWPISPSTFRKYSFATSFKNEQYNFRASLTNLSNYDTKRQGTTSMASPTSHALAKTTTKQNAYFDMYYNPKYKYEDEYAVDILDMENDYFSREEEQNFYVNDSFRSSTEGSDNILVTFDYGYCDSTEELQLTDSFSESLNQDEYVASSVIVKKQDKHLVYPISEEENEDATKYEIPLIVAEQRKNVYTAAVPQYGRRHDSLLTDVAADEEPIWFYSAQLKPDETAHIAAAFQVHRMKHELQSGSFASLLHSYTENDIDDGMLGDQQLNEQKCEEEEDDIYIVDDNEENASEDDEGEQFYDSIECA